MKKLLFSLLAGGLFTISVSHAQKAKHTFKIENGHFLYDGKSIQLHAGEMHFARVPHQYWRHRLKMIKAMGLNAVTTYIFWNWQETAPGVWNFSGDHDVAEFVKEAGEEGLFVLLRPGPYACGEWEFGGYPWWLPKTKDMVIRADNQPFLDSCNNYIQKIAGQLKDLQITHGGPIIMVQAENEFGSYVAQRPDISLENHQKYSYKIKDLLIKAGFDVPFYTADGSWLFKEGSIPGALPGADGEDDTKKLKKLVDQYHNGKGPYFVAEYYPGWLDHWAEPFPKVSASSVSQQLRKYLDDTVSFNMYMVHGGTNFAFTSGANYEARPKDEKALDGNPVNGMGKTNTKKRIQKTHDIQPDMTSYDYDAPISEAGWVTPKYDSIRNLLQSRSNAKFPEVPAAIPVIVIPDIALTKAVNLLDLAKKMKPLTNDTPLTFEDMNQGNGYMLYSKKITKATQGILSIPGLRDFAVVYINGKKVGVLNRYYNDYDMEIDIPANAELQILVENMGRINYGSEIIHNTKGIISPITIDDKEITGHWQMRSLPMSEEPKISDAKSTYTAGTPTIYQGIFNLDKTGDTFLDMRGWGKGIVFINGKNLGRYWSTVGPQLTLYVPGVWLNKGKNTVEIFEQLNDTKQPVLKTIKTPILDQLVK